MTRKKQDLDSPQLSLFFDVIDSEYVKDTLEDRAHNRQKKQLYDTDRIVFNAILGTATKQNCNRLDQNEARLLIQIGFRDIIIISGLPRRTIQRSLKRLIQATYLDVDCAARNGTEATVYLVLVREYIPEVAAADQP